MLICFWATLLAVHRGNLNLSTVLQTQWVARALALRDFKAPSPVSCVASSVAISLSSGRVNGTSWLFFRQSLTLMQRNANNSATTGRSARGTRNASGPYTSYTEAEPMVCESSFVLKRKAHSSCTVHRVCPIIPVNANDAMSNGKGKLADCPGCTASIQC
jgi:hypothetical protein